MTDKPSTGEPVVTLKPCPFCFKPLRVVPSLARAFDPARPLVEYHHEDGECIIKRAMWAFYNDEPEKFACFASKWNTRASHTGDDGLAREAVKRGFQSEVADWMLVCFGPEIAADRLERADRFVEEALELGQAMPGFTAERAHALVDYVFNRPVGERFQEVGGVMVTLAALCNTYGLNIADEAERELARVWTKVDAIRAKQASKPVGSALPAALTPPSDQRGEG